jgi:hypothetical protein
MNELNETTLMKMAPLLFPVQKSSKYLSTLDLDNRKKNQPLKHETHGVMLCN